jgi:flagellar basal-body rod protein FlgG
MLKELYTAAMGMLPQQTRLETIANNMANANTAGFKRASVFERNLIDARANFYNTPGDAEQNDPPVGSYIDYSQGAYTQTDNPLDLAIDSQNGFFMVEDADGNKQLTRAGNFKLSTEGYIVTPEGRKLLGSNQEPIKVTDDYNLSKQSAEQSKALNIRVSNNGEVSVNEKHIGDIQVVDVANLESLQQLTTSDFVIRTDTDLVYRNSDNTNIRQGWIENSNVNIVDEMVKMIELQRMFELGSKVIHTNDGTLDQSMRIGKY